MAADAARLEQLLVSLGGEDQRLRRWRLELNELRRTQMLQGASGKGAATAMVERQRAQVASGETPVDYARLDEEIVELAELYAQLPDGGRDRVRAQLREMQEVRGQVYGTIHVMAHKLRETRDERWLLAGLAMAAMEGGALDFRDLYVALGELWLSAEAVRIRPKRLFEEAAALAGEERDSLNRSGRALLLAFPHSAHLHSIKHGQ